MGVGVGGWAEGGVVLAGAVPAFDLVGGTGYCGGTEGSGSGAGAVWASKEARRAGRKRAVVGGFHTGAVLAEEGHV